MKPGEAEMTEAEVIPAHPDYEYGCEKLNSERVAMTHGRRYGMKVRITRFQNCYGPQGTWRDGREKAPAAICRNVAEAETVGRLKGGGWNNHPLLHIRKRYGGGDLSADAL
jgi:nucleoside-diphosphate-sugar epimerase